MSVGNIGATRSGCSFLASVQLYPHKRSREAQGCKLYIKEWKRRAHKPLAAQSIHAALAQRKTARTNATTGKPVARHASGVWHIRGYAEAQAVLRSTDTKQAGFKAELIERMPGSMNVPILYQEGKVHQGQRKQTARFFTPKATSAHYRQLMESLSDQIIADLKRTKRADLSTLSLMLAVRVAAQVVGLTNSLLPGLDKRLNAFFNDDLAPLGWHPRALLSMLRNQTRIAKFFYLDVRPAIQAHKVQPREDVISHLLAQGYRDSEILTECMTYAAAGMVTTREFICVAAWHLLEQPQLRHQYLTSPEEGRHRLLGEILRVEPVVRHLSRRATDNLVIESNGVPLIIPTGSLIDIHIDAVNADESIVGEQPLAICPDRTLGDDRAGAQVMSFGDGHHRCPGAFIAIQESDIFLQRLLALDGLRMAQPPTLSWKDLIAGYELRDFVVAVE
jgi:cytochrome P450